MYGIMTILDVSTSLLSTKNRRLLCISLNLLTALVNSEQYTVMMAMQSTLFKHSLQLILKSYEAHDVRVSFPVNNLFSCLLKKTSISQSVHQILEIIPDCLNGLQKILSSYLSTSAHLKKHSNEEFVDLPTELKVLISGLDVIYFILRLNVHFTHELSEEQNGNNFFLDDDTAEEKDLNKSSFQKVWKTCLLVLDQTFIPFCLILGLKTLGSKACWCHLLRALSVLHQVSYDDLLLMSLTKKLIKTNLFSHIWEVKDCEIIYFHRDCEENSYSCMENILKYLLKCPEEDEYVQTVKTGLTHMKGTISESVAILSYKWETQNQMFNEFQLSSAQRAFICICYFSYLNNGPIMRSEILTPHLIYYITCYSESISTSTILIKHVVFLIAVCMDEKTTFETGLIEASGIMCDILSNITEFSEIYTHHRSLLVWCFRSHQNKSFRSFVLNNWLMFSLNGKDEALSSLARKLILSICFENKEAENLLIELFETKPDIIFSFLKCVHESHMADDTKAINKSNLIALLEHFSEYIQSCLNKVLITSEWIAGTTTELISTGLKCLIWCQDKLSNTSEFDIKLVFYVVRFCCRENDFEINSVISCIKYLQVALITDETDIKAWYVLTGHTDIQCFILKCLEHEEPLKIGALNLLVEMLKLQIKADLKCALRLKIPFSWIFKWMNKVTTQVIVFELLNQLLSVGFINTFVHITTSQYTEDTVSSNELRVLSFYMQNAIAMGNPIIEEIAVSCFISLLEYLATFDQSLESYIMLQPWSKVLLESCLENCHRFLGLFEKFLSCKEVNASLIGVIQQLAEKLLQSPDKFKDQSIVSHLLTSAYKNCISHDTIQLLKNTFAEKYEEKTTGQDIMSQMEAVLANALSNALTVD